MVFAGWFCVYQASSCTLTFVVRLFSFRLAPPSVFLFGCFPFVSHPLLFSSRMGFVMVVLRALVSPLSGLSWLMVVVFVGTLRSRTLFWAIVNGKEERV